MAITYNGTAITSATWDGTTYKYISYNGCVAYACACVGHYTILSPDTCFYGFERKICGDCYYVRAKYGLSPYACGATRIYWAGGCALANCYEDLQLCACSYYHMSCTCIIICACGSVCGQTYRFPIVKSAAGLGTGLNMCINSSDCMRVASCVNWRSGCTSWCCLYSDWVRVCCCDYFFGTICYSGMCGMYYPRVYLSGITYYNKGVNGVGCTSSVQFQDIYSRCTVGVTAKEIC